MFNFLMTRIRSKKEILLYLNNIQAMKKNVLVILGVFFGLALRAQDLHFSQFYNSPLLLNPANTGYLDDNDWRVGLQYRNQSAVIPVPYNTFSFFSDCALFRQKWENSWLGSGLAMWKDVSGNGNLSLTKIQASMAAHVLGESSSFSVGMNAAYCQRSVDFSKLSYDVQWDEFSFNPSLNNQETFSVQKTNYLDVGIGATAAFFNNNNFHLKASVAVQHINRPNESFYGMSNKIGLRPLGSVEAKFKLSDKIMLSPCVYYSTQKRAMELVAGTLFNVNAGGDVSIRSNEIMAGAFYRAGDAFILAAGYQFGNSRVMVSYDQTVSQLTAANNGIGAFELSLILQGNYRKGSEISRTLGCPRF